MRILFTSPRFLAGILGILILALLYVDISSLGVDTWIPSHVLGIQWLNSSQVAPSRSGKGVGAHDARESLFTAQQAAHDALPLAGEPWTGPMRPLAEQLGWDEAASQDVWAVAFYPTKRPLGPTLSILGGSQFNPIPPWNYAVVTINAYSGKEVGSFVSNEGYDPGIPPFTTLNHPWERYVMIWPGVWL